MGQDEGAQDLTKNTEESGGGGGGGGLLGVRQWLDREGGLAGIAAILRHE